MSAQHTPAPWQYDGTPESLSWEVRLVRAGQTRDIFVEGFSDVEADANARLIAAAPEMLAALKSIRDTYKGTEGVLGQSVAAKIAAIDAAIAKAEGRTLDVDGGALPASGPEHPGNTRKDSAK